jgi:hypothetical protein
MHRGDAEADDGAAKGDVRTPRAGGGEPQPAPGYADGNGQRQDGEGQVVAQCNARLVGQHGKADRDRGDGEPDLLHCSGGAAGMIDQTNAGERRQGADYRRQGDEAQIMLEKQGRQYGLHG